MWPISTQSKNRKDLNRVVGRLYLLIFRHLEEYYVFNVENERHLYCLHYTYHPHINRTLNEECFRRGRIARFRDNVVNVLPVSISLNTETVNPNVNDNNYGIDTFLPFAIHQ